MKNAMRLTLSIISMGVSVSALATTDVTPKPDNSKMNQPVISGTDLTAEDQGSDRSDVDLTRKIRRSLTKDSSLSTAAQNIKIMSNQGNVVLRGPVKSAKEKQIVESRATSLLRTNAKLTSFLEVKEE